MNLNYFSQPAWPICLRANLLLFEELMKKGFGVLAFVTKTNLCDYTSHITCPSEKCNCYVKQYLSSHYYFSEMNSTMDMIFKTMMQ